MLEKTKILGVGVTINLEQEILEFLLDVLKKPRSKQNQIVIFTPNPEQVSSANSHPHLKKLLNQADVALPDGVGLVVASRLIGGKNARIKSRIAGVDFMKKLVKTVSNQPVKLGYFGGESGVAEKAALCLQNSYKNLSIGYASDTYDKNKMMHSDIDILFVGLGFPKQEQWIIDHKNEVPAKIIMAVGGSFDFISGKIPRAPKPVRTLGLEWLFRLVIQPWRIFRQARLLHFSVLILLEAVSSRLESV